MATSPARSWAPTSSRSSRDASGEREAYLIAHDWGAFAAYAAVALEPARIRALVIGSIPHPGSLRPSLGSMWKSSHFISYQLRSRSVARLRKDGFAEVDAIYRRWSPRWTPTADDLAPIKETLAAPGGSRRPWATTVVISQGRVPGRAAAEWRSRFQAPISTPTSRLLRCDSTGPLDRQRASGARAPSPADHMNWCAFRDAGHFVHREEAALFIDRTIDFLQHQRDRPPLSG